MGRAWLPWVPALGTAAPAAAVGLLRRHAARLLVPSTFHRASLVTLLGFAEQQVAVLPQPVSGDDLCPPDFEALPGRQALQVGWGSAAGTLAAVPPCLGGGWCCSSR